MQRLAALAANRRDLDQIVDRPPAAVVENLLIDLNGHTVDIQQRGWDTLGAVVGRVADLLLM